MSERDMMLPNAGECTRFDLPDASGAALMPANLVALLDTLRASVTVYVCNRRREGAPIWHVLPEVKTLVQQADPDPDGFAGRESLVEQVVRWTIGAYYDHAAEREWSFADK